MILHQLWVSAFAQSRTLFLSVTSIVEPVLLRFSYVSPSSTAKPRATLASRSDSSFTSVQAALPSIGITKRRLKQLEAVQLIREQREKRTQDLAFHTRPFVLCGLPLRRPPQGQLLYARRNGKFFLQIAGHPQFGLPTVRADCTCAPLAFGMGRNISSLPPVARSAI